MKWIFYRIDNTVNGKYYLGIHGTENIYDNYTGSGVLIREVVRECGKKPQYVVCHFLDELGMTKVEFLSEMKSLGEI